MSKTDQVSQQPAPGTELSAELVDLLALSQAASDQGPQWGSASEDLNLTLLAWPAQSGVAAHVNQEVDVVLIGVEGNGEVTVNGQKFMLTTGQALLVPKGSQRAIKSLSERFSYLSVHRRRRGLMPV